MPQPALAVDLGRDTNVTEVTFRTEATTPTTVTGAVADRHDRHETPVTAPASTRTPLAAAPFATANAGDIRSRRLRDAGSDAVVRPGPRPGRRSTARADAVVAEGKADGARYGAVLRPRGLVGMRGAGWANDGLWYVRKVEHELAPGSYTFGFTLARDGHGATDSRAAEGRGVTARFFGVYRGKVEANVDPLLRGRVQVSVPEVFGDGRLAWAEPCHAYAGDRVGGFALPPVGTSGWVQFERGDPDFPVLAGCLWQNGAVARAGPAGGQDVHDRRDHGHAQRRPRQRAA